MTTAAKVAAASIPIRRQGSARERSARSAAARLSLVELLLGLTEPLVGQVEARLLLVTLQPAGPPYLRLGDADLEQRGLLRLAHAVLAACQALRVDRAADGRRDAADRGADQGAHRAEGRQQDCGVTAARAPASVFCQSSSSVGGESVSCSDITGPPCQPKADTQRDLFRRPASGAVEAHRLVVVVGEAERGCVGGRGSASRTRRPAPAPARALRGRRRRRTRARRSGSAPVVAQRGARPASARAASGSSPRHMTTTEAELTPMTSLWAQAAASRLVRQYWLVAGPTSGRAVPGWNQPLYSCTCR